MSDQKTRGVGLLAFGCLVMSVIISAFLTWVFAEAVYPAIQSLLGDAQ